MGVQKAQFGIFFIYNAIFFVGFSWCATHLVNFCFDRNLIFTGNIQFILSVLFFVYFFSMWRDVYSKNYHYYLRNTYRYVVKNTVFALIGALAASFISYLIDDSLNLQTLTFYLLTGIVSFLLMHLTQYVWIRYLGLLGYFQKNVLIIGKPDERFPLESFFQDLVGSRKLIGRIIYENAHWVFHEDRNCNKQVIKGIHALRNVIVSHYVGKVILFTGKNLRSEYLRLIVNLCRSMRIGYYLVPDISHLPAKYPWNKLFPYIPLLECFTTERESLAKMTIKRFIDIVIAFFGLLLFLPVGIIIAFAIKHEDGGPIFYLTQRVGKNGNPVHFYKFRTMVVDAEHRRKNSFSTIHEKTARFLK